MKIRLANQKLGDIHVQCTIKAWFNGQVVIAIGNRNECHIVSTQHDYQTKICNRYVNDQFERQVAKGCSQTGNDLGDQPVQIGVGGAFNVQIPAANIVESFVIIHDGHISVLQQRMHAQHLNCLSLTVTTHTVACLDYQNIMIFPTKHLQNNSFHQKSVL